MIRNMLLAVGLLLGCLQSWTPVAASGHIIIVTGAAGKPEYGQEFAEWADRWSATCERASLSCDRIGPDSEAADDGRETDRDRLQRLLKEQAASESSSPLWLILIGHGTWNGASAKFNLEGPDVDARTLAEWLNGIRRPLVLVNCASSSGPFIDRLGGEDRVVITATKSGNEQNFARFGDYFSSAIGNPGSDLDHDDSVSVREAFLKAASDTASFYQQQGRIATEHALLEDNGDRKGSNLNLVLGTASVGGEEEVDGKLADRITIRSGADVPELDAEQIARRDELERSLEQLVIDNADGDREQLRRQALPILVQLAQLYESARQPQAEERPEADESEDKTAGDDTAGDDTAGDDTAGDDTAGDDTAGDDTEPEN
ncbi:hypothetical protein [Roseiconus nitratireducens]|uniref:hypothetical protein n=1 Tax=Roseiconus nitratireducens TaxID=2605748 RepID=UPI0013762576|nr:hypothetical protein [Roseiconus nitratireducens]